MECRKNGAMIRNSNNRLLVDSGFFFALFNPRDQYHKDTIEQAKTHRHAMSLVDTVLYAILDDINIRIDAMLTFNFRDFTDICRIQKVELL